MSKINKEVQLIQSILDVIKKRIFINQNVFDDDEEDFSDNYEKQMQIYYNLGVQYENLDKTYTRKSSVRNLLESSRKLSYPESPKLNSNLSFTIKYEPKIH